MPVDQPWRSLCRRSQNSKIKKIRIIIILNTKRFVWNIFIVAK